MSHSFVTWTSHFKKLVKTSKNKIGRHSNLHTTRWKRINGALNQLLILIVEKSFIKTMSGVTLVKINEI